jgi:outer membrane immunogenic protein
MKKLLIASSLGLALVSGPAAAADIAMKQPGYGAAPPASTVYSWTGCYIDGGVGYGMWNQDHYVETSGLVAESVSTTDGGRGWLGRVGAGCDYQVSPSIVVGAFGDYDWMGLNGTSNLNLAGTAIGLSVEGNEQETGAWSVGARAGYLITPRLLSYFDGGYTQTTFGQVNYNSGVTGATTGLSIPATTYKGWFIGGGTEYALNMAWIPIQGLFLRNEYRFDAYSSRDTPLTGTTSVSEHADKYVQTITTGAVWKFNFSGR